ISHSWRDIFEVTISNANNNRVSSLAEASEPIRPSWLYITDKVGFISDSIVIHNLTTFPIQPHLNFLATMLLCILLLKQCQRY
ncbi:hypothetical protein RhiirA4_498909, partial [Rhizophagus irregularis]